MIHRLHSYSDADEHHLLPKCEKVPIIVYDQEPSSIIAYTLRYVGIATPQIRTSGALQVEKVNK